LYGRDRRLGLVIATMGSDSTPPGAGGFVPEPLRIVTADDNYLVREGARRLLEDSGEVVVEAAVACAPDLLAAVERLRPAVVLTDIRMPVPGGGSRGGMEGIEAARAIRSSYPQTGVVVLSQYADEAYAFELFKDGVAGLAYLLKDRVGELGPQLDVLREMAQGRGNVGIAGQLHLSESSVEKHVNAIFAKLGLTAEQQSHRRVMAVLTFLRDAGLRD
jgi:DNA-binding NarL/FixJ family response regulator